MFDNVDWMDAVHVEPAAEGFEIFACILEDVAEHIELAERGLMKLQVPPIDESFGLLCAGEAILVGNLIELNEAENSAFLPDFDS
ncbi:hypothetical protein [Pseudomonas sp. LFS044]|uniref:hypothetical protein n=1 Tax=Pseudomonas sp. LFS044 TaxID=3229880 RepID=UPI003A80A6AB